jgi:hypothetical protein
MCQLEMRIGATLIEQVTKTPTEATNETAETENLGDAETQPPWDAIITVTGRGW